MKERLLHLLENCMEHGTESNLNALLFILEGMEKNINKKNNYSIDDLLQMERKLDENFCEITIPIHPVLNNALDIVHGGITATLIDATLGTLVHHLLPKELAAVTNQLNIHYISPGIGESLRCRAEIVHRGRKTMVVAGTVFRNDGKKIAYATGTFFVVNRTGDK